MATRTPRRTRKPARATEPRQASQAEQPKARTFEPAEVGRRTVFASGAMPAGIGGFRRGQWVVVKNSLPDDRKRRVGIYVQAKSMATGEVHLVDEKGDTMLSLPEHPHANIEPASLEDIPAPRRPKSHPMYASRPSGDGSA